MTDKTTQAGRKLRFEIFRYNPEDPESKPYMQTFELDETPSEVVSAWSMGASAVKVFPASVGGPGLLRALRGPLGDVLLVPTGGVDDTNARDFMASGAIARVHLFLVAAHTAELRYFARVRRVDGAVDVGEKVVFRILPAVAGKTDTVLAEITVAFVADVVAIGIELRGVSERNLHVVEQLLARL